MGPMGVLDVVKEVFGKFISQLDFRHFELRLELTRISGDDYEVQLQGLKGIFHKPLSREECAALDRRPTPELVKALGTRLFNALFTAEMKSFYGNVLEMTKKAG